MVFVNLDANGNPAPHGRTKIRYSDEAFERYSESLRAMQQPAVLASESTEDVDQEADTAH
jgi:hypothetical protein